MGAVTYPKEAVAKFVDYNFVPVQIQVTNTALVQQFGVSWTPAIMVLDPDGKEHYRSVGFLAPEEFIANFQVGKGRYYLDTDQFPEAEAMFEEALTQSQCRARGHFLHGRCTLQAHPRSQAPESGLRGSDGEISPERMGQTSRTV